MPEKPKAAYYAVSCGHVLAIIRACNHHDAAFIAIADALDGQPAALEDDVFVIGTCGTLQRFNIHSLTECVGGLRRTGDLN